MKGSNEGNSDHRRWRLFRPTSDTVMHLAAMKHIDLCEMYPLEAITTDVLGTKILLDLFSGDTFIGMSTDKVMEATNCYGATKLLTEKLILDRAKKKIRGIW